MIEAIVVLIIIAILAPIVISRTTTDTSSLISEAEVLKSSLRYAQIRAMNDTVTWGINLDSSTSYKLIRSNGSVPNLPGDNSVQHTLSGGVTLSSVVTSILFNSWGVPVDGSGNALSSDTTISLSQGSQPPNTIIVTKNTGYIP